MTTAGALPMGAGTMSPACEPGGAGTKPPSGPIAAGPQASVAAGDAKAARCDGERNVAMSSASAQWPVTNYSVEKLDSVRLPAMASLQVAVATG